MTINKIETFDITEEHLKLLRRAYVRWEDCEFGAPSIDCKRPYGNSDVLNDIAEIIDPNGWNAVDQDSDSAIDRYWAANEERLRKLHAETEIVLQIGLTTGAFKAGRYEREGYGDWYYPTAGMGYEPAAEVQS